MRGRTGQTRARGPAGGRGQQLGLGRVHGARAAVGGQPERNSALVATNLLDLSKSNFSQGNKVERAQRVPR